MTTKEIIVRLIKLDRMFGKKQCKLEKALGDFSAFDNEIGSIWKLVEEIAGTKSKEKEYRRKLSEMGAVDVAWGILEQPLEWFCDDKLVPDDVAQRLIDYGEGQYSHWMPTQDQVDEEYTDHNIETYGLISAKD